MEGSLINNVKVIWKFWFVLYTLWTFLFVWLIGTESNHLLIKSQSFYGNKFYSASSSLLPNLPISLWRCQFGCMSFHCLDLKHYHPVKHTCKPVVNNLWLSVNNFWLSVNNFWLSVNNFWLSVNNLWLSVNNLWLSVNNLWLSVNNLWLSVMPML